MNRVSINLLSSTHRSKRAHRLRLRNWICAGSVYLVALLGAACTYAMFRGSGVESLQASITQCQDRIDKEHQTIASIRKELGQLNRRAALMQGVVDRPDWSILAAALAECVDANVTMREVRVEPVSAAEPATDEALLQVFNAREVINAVARTQHEVSAFALRLEGLGLFDKVQMVRSDRSETASGKGIGFELECSIIGSGGAR